MDLRNRANLSALRRLASRILDVCYPGTCAVCQRFCDGAGPLCAECNSQLQSLMGEAACERCAKPVAQTGAPCPWCLGRGVHPFQRIVRLGEYEEPLRTLIHQMKYEGRWPLGEILAERLCEQGHAKDALGGTDCVMAVPLHWRRQFARGYNQAEVVARHLARRWGVRLVQPLRRVRDTETQTQLHSQQARRANVRGAFALLDRRGVEGRHVVVVDDVTTSGATLQAVGRVLLKAKPARLTAVVLAVADPKRRDFQAI